MEVSFGEHCDRIRDLLAELRLEMKRIAMLREMENSTRRRAPQWLQQLRPRRIAFKRHRGCKDLRCSLAAYTTTFRTAENFVVACKDSSLHLVTKSVNADSTGEEHAVITDSSNDLVAGPVAACMTESTASSAAVQDEQLGDDSVSDAYLDTLIYVADSEDPEHLILKYDCLHALNTTTPQYKMEVSPTPSVQGSPEPQQQPDAPLIIGTVPTTQPHLDIMGTDPRFEQMGPVPVVVLFGEERTPVLALKVFDEFSPSQDGVIPLPGSYLLQQQQRTSDAGDSFTISTIYHHSHGHQLIPSLLEIDERVLVTEQVAAMGKNVSLLLCTCVQKNVIANLLTSAEQIIEWSDLLQMVAVRDNIQNQMEFVLGARKVFEEMSRGQLVSTLCKLRWNVCSVCGHGTWIWKPPWQFHHRQYIDLILECGLLDAMCPPYVIRRSWPWDRGGCWTLIFHSTIITAAPAELINFWSNELRFTLVTLICHSIILIAAHIKHAQSLLNGLVISNMRAALSCCHKSWEPLIIFAQLKNGRTEPTMSLKIGLCVEYSSGDAAIIFWLVSTTFKVVSAATEVLEVPPSQRPVDVTMDTIIPAQYWWHLMVVCKLPVIYTRCRDLSWLWKPPWSSLHQQIIRCVHANTPNPLQQNCAKHYMLSCPEIYQLVNQNTACNLACFNCHSVGGANGGVACHIYAADIISFSSAIMETKAMIVRLCSSLLQLLFTAVDTNQWQGTQLEQGEKLTELLHNSASSYVKQTNELMNDIAIPGICPQIGGVQSVDSSAMAQQDCYIFSETIVYYPQGQASSAKTHEDAKQEGNDCSAYELSSVWKPP